MRIFFCFLFKNDSSMSYEISPASLLQVDESSAAGIRNASLEAGNFYVALGTFVIVVAQPGHAAEWNEAHTSTAKPKCNPCECTCASTTCLSANLSFALFAMILYRFSRAQRERILSTDKPTFLSFRKRDPFDIACCSVYRVHELRVLVLDVFRV